MRESKRLTTILALLCCAVALMIAKCTFKRSASYNDRIVVHTSEDRNKKEIPEEGELEDFDAVEIEGNILLDFIYDKEVKHTIYEIVDQDLSEEDILFKISKQDNRKVLRIVDYRHDSDNEQIYIKIKSRKMNFTGISLDKAASAKFSIGEKWLSKLNAEINKAGSFSLQGNIDTLTVVTQDASTLLFSGDVNIFHLKLADASEATLEGSSKYLKASVLRASELLAGTFKTDSIDLKLLNSSEALLSSDKVNKNDIDNSSKLIISSPEENKSSKTPTRTDSVDVNAKTYRL